jgi:hypothetical protein
MGWVGGDRLGRSSELQFEPKGTEMRFRLITFDRLHIRNSYFGGWAGTPVATIHSPNPSEKVNKVDLIAFFPNNGPRKSEVGGLGGAHAPAVLQRVSGFGDHNFSLPRRNEFLVWLLLVGRISKYQTIKACDYSDRKNVRSFAI